MTGDYAASFLPWIMIPLVGWVLPVVTLGLLFIHIESDA
jgi:photosystem I subunit VIII